MRETNLIRKIKKGDTAALNELIQAYYPSIYAFLYRKLQMDDCAKDLTQEVFLRFIRYLPTYHHEGKLIHYFYVIAGNVCKDHYKKLKYEDDIDELDYQLSDESDLAKDTIQRMQNEELMLYIGKLKDDQQNVILLKYFHQLTFQEIADMYHKPVSTIKSRHTNALAKLKEFMERGDVQ